MGHLKYLTIFDKTTGARATSLLFDADSADETKAAQDKAAKEYPGDPTMEMELGSEDWIQATSGYTYSAKTKILLAPPEPTAEEKADAEAAQQASEVTASLDKITTRVMRMSLAGGSTAALAAEYQTTLAAVTDAAALKMPDYFPVWDGSGHAYKKGDRVTASGTLYKCLQDHTSQSDWAPGAAPSLWAKVLVTGNDDTPPAWEQPDSTNPYMKRDRVTYGGKVYESTIDNNVWKPDAYPQGWKVIETEETGK